MPFRITITTYDLWVRVSRIIWKGIFLINFNFNVGVSEFSKLNNCLVHFWYQYRFIN